MRDGIKMICASCCGGADKDILTIIFHQRNFTTIMAMNGKENNND